MKPIHIEVLYPEYNNLYGDSGNMRYLVEKLHRCGAEVRVTETHLADRPAFADGGVDVLYIGPCTEAQQQQIAGVLAPYKDALRERMESESVTLMTGNALELLFERIENEDGTTFEGLSLLPAYAKRFTRFRYNDVSAGVWQDLTVVGFKNQLSHGYRTGDFQPFLQMHKGCGLHPDDTAEGFAKGWFFATYLIGPLLPLNPLFTERLISHLLGESVPCELPFERQAYEARLCELSGNV